MIRRDFIKTAGAVMASAALSPSAMQAVEGAEGRTILPINRNSSNQRPPPQAAALIDMHGN